MALSTSLSVVLKAFESIAAENQSGVVVHTFDAFGAVTLDNGTASGQADRVFSDRRTLTAGSNENLDLAGSLVPVFGGTFTAVKAKIVAIYNRTTGQILTFKKGAANGWGGLLTGSTDGLTIQGGGFVFWYDPSGTTVTAGTGDIVNITNSSGASMDYDIFVVGTSA